MDVARMVKSKLKGFEDIKEELEETGLAKEQLKEYYDLYEEYATNVKDANKLNKKERDAEDEYLKEDEKVKKIEKRMKKIRQKAGPLARLKLSRVFFWSKEGRIYRILKRRLKRAKARRNLALHTLKELSAKAKGQEKSLKQKTKSLKKSEKSIRKIWEQNKDEISLMRQMNQNKQKIENIYSKEQQGKLDKSIKELQEEGDLPLEVEANDLNKEIDEAIRSGKQPENSVIDEVKEEKIEQVEIEDIQSENIKLKEKETDEYEMTSTEIPEASWTIEEKEETIDKQEEKTEENEFKESLKEGVVFGPNTTIDRRKIEMMQKNQNNKILNGMTPEEYMAYIGFVETKRRANEPVKYEEFLEEMGTEQGSQTKTFYAKRAIHSLEKMETNKSEKEIEEMDEADQFIYGIAEDYHKLIEQEEKQQQEQQGMEIG